LPEGRRGKTHARNRPPGVDRQQGKHNQQVFPTPLQAAATSSLREVRKTSGFPPIMPEARVALPRQEPARANRLPRSGDRGVGAKQVAAELARLRQFAPRASIDEIGRSVERRLIAVRRAHWQAREHPSGVVSDPRSAQSPKALLTRGPFSLGDSPRQCEWHSHLARPKLQFHGLGLPRPTVSPRELAQRPSRSLDNADRIPWNPNHGGRNTAPRRAPTGPPPVACPEPVLQL
jgi:hypothetical protein